MSSVAPVLSLISRRTLSATRALDLEQPETDDVSHASRRHARAKYVLTNTSAPAETPGCVGSSETSHCILHVYLPTHTHLANLFHPLETPFRPISLFPRLLLPSTGTAQVGVGSGAFNAVLYDALLGVTSNCTVALPSLKSLVGVPTVLYAPYPPATLISPVAMSVWLSARAKTSSEASGW